MNNHKSKLLKSASITLLVALLLLVCYHIISKIKAHPAFADTKMPGIETQFAYLVDTTSQLNGKSIDQYNREFISVENNEIPYELGEQTYWVSLKIINSLNKSQNLVIYTDNAMLEKFDVFIKQVTTEEYTKRQSEQFNLYHNRTVNIGAKSTLQFYVNAKSIGPPNIPIMVLQEDRYQTLVVAAKGLYGIFVTVLLVMAIYNLIIYFAVKDKVYIAYLGYLVSALIVLSSTNGYAKMIFTESVVDFVNQYSLFFHYYLVMTLLLFTLFFLRYSKINATIYKFGISFSLALIAISFVTQLLPHEIQAKTFFTLQPLFYVLVITIIAKRFNADFKWARFYFVSWVALIIGGVIQPLVLLNIVEHTLLTRNAFLIAVFIEICFMSFALAERMKRNEFDRIKDVTYHASSGLPRKTNIESTLSHLIKSKHNDLAIVIIKPEQIDRISLYIDDAANTTLFQNIYQKLSTLFSYNDAILPLTNAQEKLCFINNNSLAILVDEKNSNISLEQLVNSIQEFVSESFVVEDVQLPLSALVGISRYPEHGKHAHQLINHAQLALTQAQHQLQKSAIYEQSASSKSTEHLQLAADLKQAIVNNELSVFHQPQIDLKTQRVCSSECLLRWHHPSEGMISPDVFISIAEDTGLINELTFWVIKQSLYQQNLIANENGFNHMLSINISGKDLVNPQFFVKAVELIEQSGIPPEKIIFELTESLSFSTNAKAVSVIEKLGEIGITVSIDDFGTGYSSMAQISGLPFQELKIDRQFVENIAENEKHLIITEATIKMAKGMSLEVVAEGINSEKDERTLTDLGCDIGQGFYYAKPMPINEYLDWLHRLDNGKIPGPIIGDYLPAD